MTFKHLVILSSFLFPAVVFPAAFSAKIEQGAKIERVEPPHWWLGMNNPELQLMVYGKGIANYNVSTQSKGISVINTHRQENPNYLYVDITISSAAEAGTFELVFSDNADQTLSYHYELKQRETGSAQRAGFSSKDAIYLITPDRFANGDPGNDNHPDMFEIATRSHDYGRHGGDLQGIIQNIDYLADLGVTQIWSSPLLENNVEAYSYHGYSITDLYKVDPRFGGNDQYVALSKAASAKGIGLIMDTIPNHIGINHWWMKDLPSSDWINNNGVYKQTTHVHETNIDPYASEQDKADFSDGWFVESMPDLNQKNPFLARYLIQNNIWWIEEASLTGLRVDTYPYADKSFMVAFSEQILNEFPAINIVGEVWRLEKSPHSMISYYQHGKLNQDGFKPSSPSLMDFPLQADAMNAFTSDDPVSGAMQLYLSLATDYVYPDPMSLVVLPDNHDMDRVFTWINRDIDLLKVALSFFATTRGALQLYYGTEVLLANDIRHHHGDIRRDFPGGWEGDKINAFTRTGLSKDQEDVLEFTSVLLNWRKNAPAIHDGILRHYVPKEGVYVYFRIHSDQKVMVLINLNKEETSVETNRFAEHLGDSAVGLDILSNESVDVTETLQLKAKSAKIIEFGK